MRWSFSKWNLYNRCPFAYYLKYIDKIEYPSNKGMEKGIESHKRIQDYLTGVTDNPPIRWGTKILDEIEDLRENGFLSEQQWFLDNNWSRENRQSWLTVIVDAYIDDKNLFEIVDFKTGKEYADSKEQMHLYATAALSIFGYSRVITSLIYLESAKVKSKVFYKKDLSSMQELWNKRIKKLEEDNDYLLNPGNHCYWCGYRKKIGGPCAY